MCCGTVYVVSLQIFYALPLSPSLSPLAVRQGATQSVGLNTIGFTSHITLWSPSLSAPGLMTRELSLLISQWTTHPLQLPLLDDGRRRRERASPPVPAPVAQAASVTVTTQTVVAPPHRTGRTCPLSSSVVRSARTPTRGLVEP